MLPAYFNHVCMTVAWAHLRSAERHNMFVLRGRRRFHVAALPPAIWNSLPTQLHSASAKHGQLWDGLKPSLHTGLHLTPLRFKRLYASDI